MSKRCFGFDSTQRLLAEVSKNPLKSRKVLLRLRCQVFLARHSLPSLKTQTCHEVSLQFITFLILFLTLVFGSRYLFGSVCRSRC